MFRRTILLLTLQYSLFILGICTLFSFGVYRYVDRSFGGDYINSISSGRSGVTQGDETDPQLTGAQEATDAGLDILHHGLLLFNGGLVVLVPLLSFIMARRALKPIQENYESQQHFVDNASHELRTPLAIIQGELELALKRPRSVKGYQETLLTSLEKVGGLSTLTHSLLLLARKNKLKIERSFTSFSGLSLLQEAIKLAQGHQQKKHILVLLHASHSINLRGNAQLLTQAFANIIENSLKFTEKGKVTVIAREVNNTVLIVIQDTGTGMSKKEASKAFERFYRAETSRTTAGHGLGLALAKQIIEEHGGKISLISLPYEGTTVTVVLPLDPLSS